MASEHGLQQAIEHLAAIDRSSCSPGEREAAAWIAAALGARGADADVELEDVHGTYWWPLSLTSALGLGGAAATLRGRRLLGAALGTAGAAGVIDDIAAGRRWLRRALPKQTTANVVAETGDRAAARTVLLVCHHDAAHSGVFFNPAIADIVGRFYDSDPDAPPRMPAVMAPVLAAPALVALGAAAGSRRIASLAGAACAGIAASMADIAASATVPGANDNLTGVATLLGVADALQRRPPHGLRVMLVSTGAEEALMEGMRAFAHRHLRGASPAHTCVVCVDSVGSARLVLAEAEGMLRVRDHDPRLNRLIADCAREQGIVLKEGLRMRLGTDGYIALRCGLPTALLTSLDPGGGSADYHWKTDTPERVDHATLLDAVRLCEAVVRRLADSWPFA